MPIREFDKVFDLAEEAFEMADGVFKKADEALRKADEAFYQAKRSRVRKSYYRASHVKLERPKIPLTWKNRLIFLKLFFSRAKWVRL